MLHSSNMLQQMQARYQLAQDRHACRVGDSWVILDTCLDRYFCFADQQAAWFSELVCRAPLSPEAKRFAARLCTLGILVSSSDHAEFRTVKQAATSTPISCLTPDTVRRSPRITEVFAFVLAMAQLGHLQNPRQRNLRQIISSAHAWKKKARLRAAPPNELVFTRTRAFHDLAPWFFTSCDACFFRSLLLMRYLAHFGAAPEWTFGVRLSPFRAHCWISYGGMLLNEDCDTVEGYQPILTV